MWEWTKAAEKDRIRRYVDSFHRLAETFQYMPTQKERLSEEDVEEIYEIVRDTVCGACGRRQDCWGKNDERTYRLIYEMLVQIEEGIEEPVGMSTSFFRYCIRSGAFREELKNCFYRAKLNLMWSNRMLENRAAVAEQLQETAQIIREIACTVYDAQEEEGELERKVRVRMRMHRIRVKDLRVSTNILGKKEIIMTMTAGRGQCISTREIAVILSEIYGCVLVPERDSRITVGKEQSTIHFCEDTDYYMLTGMAGVPCMGQSVSGDNFAFLNANHGQVVMSLSDGMGVGNAACKESQAVIELLEQFLEAGFTVETAVRMINSSMVLQRGMQRFSTLDICSMNLYTGVCEMLKIGAATTYIKRQQEVEAVISTSLPVGVLQEVDWERIEKKLEPGDMIIMISDGVLDALPKEEGEELMSYLISRIRSSNPAEFANILLEQVQQFAPEGPKDDLTILVGGFWKK